MKIPRIFKFFLISLLWRVKIISANPVSDSSEDAISSPSTTSPPLCRNFIDYHNFPQLVFPTCTSIRSPECLRNIVMHGMACTCDLNTHDVQKRDDYNYSQGIGAHKLHTRGSTFNDARRVCNEEGRHLAIINSIAEEEIPLRLFEAAGPIRSVTTQEHAYIGIHNLFGEGAWVTILGESLHKTGYTKWSDRWGGQPDNGGETGQEQHCGALLKGGGIDDISCNQQFAYFCEIPGIRIAH